MKKNLDVDNRIKSFMERKMKKYPDIDKRHHKQQPGRASQRPVWILRLNPAMH